MRDPWVNACSWPYHRWGINSFDVATGSQEQRGDGAGMRLGSGEHRSQGWPAAKSEGKIRIGCFMVRVLHRRAKSWWKREILQQGQ